MATLRKMWIAVGATLASLLYSLLADGNLTTDDLAVLLTQGGGVVLVWYVANTGDAWYAKAMAAGWTGGAVVFMTALPDGVHGDEWGQIVIAIINAVLVLAIGNQKTSPTGNTRAAHGPAAA